MKKLYFVLLWVTGLLQAQQDSIRPYYEAMPNKISVDFYFQNISDSYEFYSDYDGQRFSEKLYPNKQTSLNIGVKYDFISFSYGFAPDFLARKKNVPDTKMTTFSLNLQPGRLLQHLEFAYSKGLIFDLGLDGEHADTVFRKLTSLKIGGRTSWLFNKNFSFQAISNQNERQLRSVGTFAPALSYYYSRLDARTEGPLLEGKIAVGQFKIDDATTYISAYVGYRFDAPGFLSSRMEKVKQKNPFQKKKKSDYATERVSGAGIV